MSLNGWEWPMTGDFREACARFEESLTIKRELGTGWRRRSSISGNVGESGATNNSAEYYARVWRHQELGDKQDCYLLKRVRSGQRWRESRAMKDGAVRSGSTAFGAEEALCDHRRRSRQGTRLYDEQVAPFAVVGEKALLQPGRGRP